MGGVVWTTSFWGSSNTTSSTSVKAWAISRQLLLVVQHPCLGCWRWDRETGCQCIFSQRKEQAAWKTYLRQELFSFSWHNLGFVWTHVQHANAKREHPRARLVSDSQRGGKISSWCLSQGKSLFHRSKKKKEKRKVSYIWKDRERWFGSLQHKVWGKQRMSLTYFPS